MISDVCIPYRNAINLPQKRALLQAAERDRLRQQVLDEDELETRLEPAKYVRFSSPRAILPLRRSLSTVFVMRVRSGRTIALHVDALVLRPGRRPCLYHRLAAVLVKLVERSLKWVRVRGDGGSLSPQTVLCRGVET